MSSGVECYWGEGAKTNIDVFVKEVMEEVTSIRECLSGEETAEESPVDRIPLAERDVSLQDRIALSSGTGISQASLGHKSGDVDDSHHVDSDGRRGSGSRDDGTNIRHPSNRVVDHRTTIEGTATNSTTNRDYDFGSTRPTVASVQERLAQLRSETAAATATTHQEAMQARTDDSRTKINTSDLPNSTNAGDVEQVDAWPNDDDEDAELEELSWRMNPLKSMSDWMIHVVVTSPSQSRRAGPNGSSIAATDVYHVHKSVLAVGPRRSNYFLNLFREHHQMMQQNLQQQHGLHSPTSGTSNVTTVAKHTSWQLPDIPSATTILGLPASAAHPFTPRAASNSAARASHAAAATGTSYSSMASPHAVTRLELPALAASAFPVLLDFLYDSHYSGKGSTNRDNERTTPTTGRFRLTTHNATALHVLAQRFDMKALRSVTRDYWMADLRLDTLAVYYQHATCLDDALILRALEMYTAQHLFDTTSSTSNSASRGSTNATIADIFDLLDPKFVLNVITLAWSNHDSVATADSVGTKVNWDTPMDRHSLSLRLSVLVAVYCHQRHSGGDGEGLDYAMFEQLTDARLLPTLEAPAAKALLELQEALHSEHVRNERLTSLTERCIAVLAEHWDDACILSEHEQRGGRSPNRTVSLPPLTGVALEAFVQQSLVNAKDRLVRLEAEKLETTHRHDKLQQDNDALRHENDMMKAQLQELKLSSPTGATRPLLLPPTTSPRGLGQTTRETLLAGGDQLRGDKRARSTSLALMDNAHYVSGDEFDDEDGDDDEDGRVANNIQTPPRLEHAESSSQATYVTPEASSTWMSPNNEGSSSRNRDRASTQRSRSRDASVTRGGGNR